MEGIIGKKSVIGSGLAVVCLASMTKACERALVILA